MGTIASNRSGWLGRPTACDRSGSSRSAAATRRSSIVHDRAFTIEQRGDQEVVAAYDVADRRELWTARLDAAFSETLGGDGPRATPTWHDGRRYALGAHRRTACARRRYRAAAVADQHPRRRRRVEPAVGHVRVTAGRRRRGGRPAGRRRRPFGRRLRSPPGNRAWSALDDSAGYASPMLVDDRRCANRSSSSARSRLIGLSHGPAARCSGSTPGRRTCDVNVADRWCWTRNRVFLSAGYGMGAALLSRSRAGDHFDVEEVWRSPRMKNQFTSSVLLDGYIYGLDESILACINATTGELKWKGGPLRLWPAPARQRASDRDDRRGRSRARARVAGSPHEIARVRLRSTGQDVESPGARRWYLLVRNIARDGGVRSARYEVIQLSTAVLFNPDPELA